MTETQRRAYDDFIDYMVHLYRKYQYLFEEDEDQQTHLAE